VRERRTQDRGPSRGVLALLAAGGALAWLVGRRRGGGGGGGRAPPPPPPADVEYGPAPFPPVKVGKQWEHLRRLARVAEDVSQIDGLYSFLLATAKGESGGVPSAMNSKTDGGPAFSLFCHDRNFAGRYSDNPWRPEACTKDDPLASRWSYSGGWFQIMPAVALATSDDRGHMHDPARVFDPPFAVAYATDLVRRLKVGYGAETWGDIRAGWALPSWARPSSEAEGKLVVIERFIERLDQVSSMGADPALATEAVSTRHYPGFTKVLHALLVADGRRKEGAA
jgi:hypothetical protein